MLCFVESRLVKVGHIQAAHQDSIEAQPGENLQRPVDHRAGIKDALANIGAKTDIRALRMKAHRRILLVSALYRFAGDFRLVNLIATVLNQRQTAAQRVPIAIDDFGDPVHGGEQQNIRLADNGADNVRLLIEKFHVDDGIERKVQPVGKMPGAIDAHHRDRFRQQGKIDIAG